MEHVRVDEGVKRGRKPRKASPWRRNPETGMIESIPSSFDPQEILKKYLTAPTSSWLARELGVKRTSLTKWLKEKVPNEWKAVQVLRAEIMREDGHDGLYGSRTALELSRAREVLRAAQWDLERLDPSNYGPKQETTIKQEAPILNVYVVAAQPSVIKDVQPDALPQPDKSTP